MAGLNSPRLHATHIVGGEMYYRCLGNNLYEIILNLRRDCKLGSPEAEFDDPAHIAVFNDRGEPLRNIGNLGVFKANFNKDDTLNEILTTECEVIGGEVCVHTTSYRIRVNLPVIKGGYILAYQRCCRNATLTNIADPLNTGATYTLRITEEALLTCNSSPRFGAFPPIYICGDKPIIFNQALDDKEGDSLVYSLCAPYVGADTSNAKPTFSSRPPYNLVTYQNGYSVFQMLGPRGFLQINRRTGLLTGFPDTNVIGQYLIGICIDEYRNGKLLSSIRRDFQYNVRICTTNPIANFEPDKKVICPGDDPVVHFKNTSINANRYIWYFQYPNLNISSTDPNPSYRYTDAGQYTIALVAVRAKDCIDTSFATIIVYDSSMIRADFNVRYGSCDNEVELFTANTSFDSLFSIARNDWTASIGGRNFRSNLKEPRFIFTDTGKASIKLIVSSTIGCKDSVQKEFQINRLKPEFISGSIPICIGESTRLIVNPDSRFSYSWTPSDFLSCDNCPDPVAKPPSNQLYKVRVFDGNCHAEDSVLVKVSELLDIDIAADTVVCSDSVFLRAIGGVENSIEWSLDREFNSIIKSGSYFLDTIIGKEQRFFVRGKSSANCPGSDSLLVKNEKLSIEVPNQKFRFCQKDTFPLVLKNNLQHHRLRYLWTPDTNIVYGQGTDSVMATVSGCGKFNFNILAKNQYDCQGQSNIDVDIVCLPHVEFEVKKDCDNTLVSFINKSDIGTYLWNFGDQQTATEVSPVHFYEKTGRYTVTLQVNAECKNEGVQVIDVGFIMLNLNDTVLSCDAQPVFLNPNPDLDYSYFWSPAEYLNDPNLPNPTASPPSTKTYKVRITDNSIPDCFIEREVTVFVPPPINLEVNSDTILCYTDTLLLRASTSLRANIEWIDEVGILLGRGYQLLHKFSDSTRVIAFATDERWGCSDSDTFKVVPVKTDLRIVGDTSLCPETTGVLELVSKYPHQYSIAWAPQRFIVGKINEPKVIVKPSDTTLFFVDVVDEYGCSFRVAKQVNISRFVPPLEAYADKDTIYLGESTYLHVTRGYKKYQWVIPYNLDCTDCTDPLASPEFTTLYSVKATNEDGCVDEANVAVYVIRPTCDERDIYVPNIFSPNQDGENDDFKVLSNFIDQIHLIIYNRWGEKIFETKDKNQAWDGTYKGSLLPPDVYAYYFNVVCIGDGKKYAKKGNVTLIR